MEIPVWVLDSAIIIPALTVVLGPLTWLLRRELMHWKAEIASEVKRSTYPIQPEANGGKSLPDVFHRFDTQDANIAELRDIVLRHVTDNNAHN